MDTLSKQTFHRLTKIDSHSQFSERKAGGVVCVTSATHVMSYYNDFEERERTGGSHRERAEHSQLGRSRGGSRGDHRPLTLSPPSSSSLRPSSSPRSAATTRDDANGGLGTYLSSAAYGSAPPGSPSPSLGRYGGSLGGGVPLSGYGGGMAASPTGTLASPTRSTFSATYPAASPSVFTGVSADDLPSGIRGGRGGEMGGGGMGGGGGAMAGMMRSRIQASGEGLREESMSLINDVVQSDGALASDDVEFQRSLRGLQLQGSLSKRALESELDEMRATFQTRQRETEREVERQRSQLLSMEQRQGTVRRDRFESEMLSHRELLAQVQRENDDERRQAQVRV